MDELAAAYVNGLTTATDGPIWIFTIGVLVILSAVLVKLFPLYKDFKTKQLEIEENREKRKAEEARMRNERERENASISARQIDAQERASAAMNAMTAQMAILDSRLETSQKGSANMQDRMEVVAVEVHDLHTALL